MTLFDEDEIQCAYPAVKDEQEELRLRKEKLQAELREIDAKLINGGLPGVADTLDLSGFSVHAEEMLRKTNSSPYVYDNFSYSTTYDSSKGNI